MSTPSLLDVISRLEAALGRPKPPRVVDLWEQVLLENVVYLASDEDRDRAFRDLKRRVGTKPRQILKADRATLRGICGSAGILAGNSLEKLLDAAEVAETEFGGELPADIDKKSLKKFPGIGDPGAEKILLFAGRGAALALDSNGLRVLVRLGFAPDGKNYATMYRAAQKEAMKSAKMEIGWLTKAHQLLRQHGKTTCKHTEPRCDECVLRSSCPVGLQLKVSRR